MTRRLVFLIPLAVASGCALGTYRSPKDAPPITQSKPAQLKCGQLDGLTATVSDSTPPVCIKSVHSS